MTKINEQYYRAAQKDPTLRRNFLKEINLGEYRKFTSIIEYVPKQLVEDKRPALMGQIGPTILVFPDAFESSPEFFRSGIFEHEMHHAMQDHYHLFRCLLGRFVPVGKENRAYHTSLTEIPAYHNQIAHIGTGENGRILPQECSLLLEGLRRYTEEMKTIAEKKKRDWKEDLSKVLLPSPLDDPVRNFLGL
ncbi:MAG: hypothetical protein WCI72_06880 [archaeon]